MHHRQGQAGIGAAAIDQHRAGAALAVVAAFLGVLQRQRFAQRVEHGGAGVDGDRVARPLTWSAMLIRFGAALSVAAEGMGMGMGSAAASRGCCAVAWLAARTEARPAPA